MNLNTRNVVITGGASGIGFALAKNLGARGCRIMIAEPDEQRLQAAVAKLTRLDIDAHYCICDVSDHAQVERLADTAWETFNRVDMVFNNAGVGIRPATVIDTDVDALKAMFDVNFFGVWYGSQVFGKRFLAQGTPAGIYNTGSENSLFNAVPENAGYLATKHAVLGMTDNLREQMPDHINVGLIIPGLVKSDLTARIGHLAMDTDEFAEIVLKQIGDGKFYIVSHACNVAPIKDRYSEIQQAYADYAPPYEGDEKYDVRHLLKQMQASKSN